MKAKLVVEVTVENGDQNLLKTHLIDIVNHAFSESWFTKDSEMELEEIHTSVEFS